jgi:hypothetical protein
MKDCQGRLLEIGDEVVILSGRRLFTGKIIDIVESKKDGKPRKFPRCIVDLGWGKRGIDRWCSICKLLPSSWKDAPVNSLPVADTASYGNKSVISDE